MPPPSSDSFHVRYWLAYNNIHMASLLSALADAHRGPVIMTVRHAIEPGRPKLGWQAPDYDYGRAQLEIVPDWDLWPITQHNGLHIISNPFQDPIARRLWRRLLAAGERVAFECAEPGAHRGHWGAWLRRRVVWLFARGKAQKTLFLLTHGRRAASTLINCGFPVERVIPWGYWLSHSATCRQRQAVDTIRIVYLGQFIRRKRLDLLLHALSMLPRDPPWICDAIGTGQEQSVLEQQMFRLGLNGRVRWLPSISHRLAHEVLTTYDLLVLPSSADEWGATTNEAIGAGLAVVCTDKCGSQDIVRDACCGSVVRANSAQALKHGLVHVMDHLVEYQSAARNYRERISATTKAKELALIIQRTM